MAGTHQELATRVEGKNVGVLLILADYVEAPLGSQWYRRRHATRRNINERCMIILLAAGDDVCPTVRTEGLLIQKRRFDPTRRWLQRHRFKI